MPRSIIQCIPFCVTIVVKVDIFKRHIDVIKHAHIYQLQLHMVR